MTALAEVLTDEVIERVANRVMKRVPGDLFGTRDHNAERIRMLVLSALREERTPRFRFVVEVEATTRDEAVGLLHDRLDGNERFRWHAIDEDSR